MLVPVERRKMTRSIFMWRLFKICTDFLVFLTRIFHTDYKRISVWVNIYAQGFVMFAAAATLFVMTIVRDSVDGMTAVSWIGLLLSLFQMVVVVWACWRYRPPWEKAFDRCYWDLERLASKINISYTLLNVLIFIVIFLILLFLDIFLIV